MKPPGKIVAVGVWTCVAGLVITLSLSGCGDLSYRPAAVGKTGEVVVVVDSLLWLGPAGDALRSELGRDIETLPAPEPLFDLTHEMIGSQSAFDRISARRTIVFAAALSDTTTEANFVRSVFSEDARRVIETGTGVFVDREDTWRRNQRVIYLAAPDVDELVSIARRSGSEIRDILGEHERRYLEAEMFESGRQFNLEDTLLVRHDFRVKVQHDYLIAADTTDFVWLRRILPDSWRSLFVYYEEYADPIDLTPEWIYRTRDSLGQEYLLGNVGGYINVDYRRPLEARNIDFLDRYGFEVRGLWHMIGPDDSGEIVPYGMGGPFLTYAFYDQDSGRIYLIDGMVFAPGFRKREFLRQLEVIAHTFRSRTDVDAATVAAVTSVPGIGR
jgi:hypothetical protein